MNRSEAGMLGARASEVSWRKRCERRTAEAIASFDHETKRCPNCQNPIAFAQRRNTFCNHSCRAQFHNKKRGTTGRCLACHVKVKGKRKFCSGNCSSAHRTASTLETIRTTGVAPHPVTAKKFLTAQHGYRCAQCETVDWQGKRLVLTLDHIDGNPYNNAIVNLRLLCPNCHSQTPSFTGRNRGKGRSARREAYRRKKAA